ncbi:right-handed parallel beta-helix repeat-containing protein [Streptomyces swartbergensis]|uniref:Right handed beta helix domain-containing protein n=1 Tax=Streptomyces swartbergensis TaxID=487165 RepID=A0A243S4U9_9ACTN|nr:right-handed parallel beta-helix repeat-containing protein [Streptomyces swartbergensis]OUD02578.1 hypothetical protein CA983_14225 [Streptomyces swartbergensis]
MLYTFGGSPADVLMTETGDVVPDYPLIIRRAGTGERVTALYEANGVTPIGELRTNGASHPQPGAVRTFKADDVTAIEYEYLDANGQPVRWYQPARELAADAAAKANAALPAAGGTMTGTLTHHTASDTAIAEASLVGAEAFDRYRRLANGEQQWGSGTAGRDVRLYRSGAKAMTLTAALYPDAVSLAGSRVFNVIGAIGDGVADDRAVIQAQLDAARDAGGGIVVLPPGRTYGVGTFLVVYDRTVIVAYGATIRAIGNSGILRNFLGSETFAGYSGHSGITILGGVWDGNAADGVVGTVTGMTNVLGFVHCTDVTVRDAIIRNTSSAHALEFNSTDGARVINCRFEGFRDNSGNGSRQFAEAVQIDLAKSGSSSIGQFDNTPSRNVTVHGCYFGPSSRLGPPGRAVGSHTVADGVYYDNITVTGCRIDGALQEGIHGYGWRRAVVADNVITGTGLAAVKFTVPDPASAGYALTPHSIDVHGNVIESNAAEAAVQVIGFATALYRGVAIVGNTSRSSGSVGFRADYCNGPILSDNIVDSSSSTGVFAQFGTDPVMSGNSVRNAGSNALNVTGCVGGAVVGNVVNGTTANFGVFVGQAGDGTSATDVLVSGNAITAPASAGIRLSTGAARCLVVGNRVRKGAGAATSALSMAASATGCSVLHNDFSGNGWSTSAAMSVSTAAPITSPAGGSGLPGSNIVLQLNAPSSATAANTTAETVIASGTIPGGDAVAGSAYRLVAHGVASTTGTPTLTLRVRLGGVSGPVIAQYAAVTTASAISNRGWRVEGSVHCISTGSSGTWAGGGALYHHLASTTGAAQHELTDAPITRDSTVDQLLVITAQWSVASASNTVAATAVQVQRAA